MAAVQELFFSAFSLDPCRGNLVTEKVFFINGFALIGRRAARVPCLSGGCKRRDQSRGRALTLAIERRGLIFAFLGMRTGLLVDGFNNNFESFQ